MAARLSSHAAADTGSPHFRGQRENTMHHEPHRELHLDHTCRSLHLPAGAVLHCHAGRLWLTRETHGQAGASPDIMLVPGQRHRVASAGMHFLTHLRTSGPAARCSVELPAPRATLRRVFSWR
jgi:hypothetical protein